jgi:hypothetical protein
MVRLILPTMGTGLSNGEVRSLFNQIIESYLEDFSGNYNAIKRMGRFIRQWCL